MPTYLPAFMSHAHADNMLCDPYHAALTRSGVACYYDRQNPQVGHSLSLALQQELERAKALIVMVSPASLASFWVNEEIDMFLSLMAKDRSRKMVPIKVAPCELPPRLESRWWLDATRYSQEQIVEQLARALEISRPAASAVTGHTGPFTRVVDWRRGMGDHTTVVEALKAARPGERILVRKGIYEGALVIDKPVELVGDGQLGDVEVRATGAYVLQFIASHGRVANLTLNHTDHGDGCCVSIEGGRLDLEDCDISSWAYAGVASHRLFGEPYGVRRNRIHGTRAKDGAGIVLMGGVKCIVEENEVFHNAGAGVSVLGHPTVRRNHIYQNGGSAVQLGKYGGGVFEENDLRDNKRGPWDIDDANTGNVIRRGNKE